VADTASAITSLVLAAFAIAAGAPSTAHPPDSGVTGVVRSAPTCAPPLHGGCPMRSLRIGIEVRRASDGAQVTTARPGPLGVFRVRLAPGRYVLRAVAGTKLVAAHTVRVRAHAFTFVVIAPAARPLRPPS
jgi:hypothetical protein